MGGNSRPATAWGREHGNPHAHAHPDFHPKPHAYLKPHADLHRQAHIYTRPFAHAHAGNGGAHLAAGGLRWVDAEIAVAYSGRARGAVPLPRRR
ncbi:MAG: hypothetical protein Kow00123_10380 [Anaerolineales bacterium]